MTVRDFVLLLKPHAQVVEAKTGIHADAILAQAALESGWGKYAPGNMYFGQKDFDGINGNEQLLTTFEYNVSAVLTPAQIGLQSIKSIVPVILNGKKFFKYTGKAWFRSYKTASECFAGHVDFFFKNSRYKAALLVKGDAEKFLREVAKAGYAQSPTYETALMGVLKQIKKI